VSTLSLTTLTPPARLVDPRGQRFGAAVSAVILAGALAIDAVPLPGVVALVGLALLASSAFGTRYWILGRPWPLVRRALRLGPTELEHEYPPRFAQALGATALALALVALALDATLVGSALVAAVIALQTLLAATGICVGCRLYFLRWYVPSLFARAIGRRVAGTGIPATTLRSPR
jgi:hypothetical protein